MTWNWKEHGRFPVLNQQNCRPRDRKTMPRSVPWEFAEKFRAQAEDNHDQTLERLAERGGLAPEEMWCAAHGKGLFTGPGMRVGVDEQIAIDWLYEASGEPTPEETRQKRLAHYKETLKRLAFEAGANGIEVTYTVNVVGARRPWPTCELPTCDKDVSPGSTLCYEHDNMANHRCPECGHKEGGHYPICTGTRSG